MKNWLIILAVLVVLGVGGYFVYTNKYKAMPSPATSSAPAAVVGANTVSISNFAFSPTPLTVKAGTTVTWQNMDSVAHQIKSDTFNSGLLNQGDTFTFTFNTKGTFDYSCAIHPTMTGQIVVQ